MDHPIEAIFLDVGNTLRIVIEDEEFMAQAKKDLMMLVGTKETEEAFFAKLDARWNSYRKQSEETLLEASEKQLWTKWLLPDYPAETIAPLSGRLTRLWRDKDGRRIGVEPSRYVYVGDNPVRDVEGCREAGFGMMILFMEPATLAKVRIMKEHLQININCCNIFKCKRDFTTPFFVVFFYQPKERG